MVEIAKLVASLLAISYNTARARISEHVKHRYCPHCGENTQGPNLKVIEEQAKQVAIHEANILHGGYDADYKCNQPEFRGEEA